MMLPPADSLEKLLEAQSMFLDDVCFPPLPDDLEDLFSDDLMQLLKAEDMGVAPAPMVVVAAPEDGRTSSSSSGSATTCPASQASKKQQQAGTAAATSSGNNVKGSSTKGTKAGPARTVTTEQRTRSKKDVKQPVAMLDPVDTDSDDSMDTVEDAVVDEAARKVNKRKAPEIDWRSIEDPAERRRQRRLAKNRVTAARSRERKKLQWSDMETKLSNLESENMQLKAVLEQFARENSVLRDQLASLSHRSTSSFQGGFSNGEPAVLVFIATLLLLCCVLPGAKVVAAGSGVPLVLLTMLSKSNEPLSDMLLRFLATLKVLLRKCAKGLRKSVHAMLFQRHHIFGRQSLWCLSSSAASTDFSIPGLSSMLMPSLSKALPVQYMVS